MEGDGHGPKGSSVVGDVSVIENSEPSVKSIDHLLEPGGPVTVQAIWNIVSGKPPKSQPVSCID